MSDGVTEIPRQMKKGLRFRKPFLNWRARHDESGHWIEAVLLV